MTSVALFTISSALCGLAAWSVPSLIVFRVLQGLGGGLIQPVGQSMLAQAAGPSRLGRLMSVAMIPIAVAPVAGPVLGGVIVQGLDWRWMFLINLPIGLLTLLFAHRVLPAPAPRSTTAPASRLDVLGMALLSPGLAALVYACAAHTWWLLAPAGALLLGYLGHALRGRAGAGTNPPLDVRLFARRGFSAAASVTFLVGAALYGAMLLLPLYFQQVRGAGAIDAGLLLAPQAVGTAAASLLAGRLLGRIGARSLVLAGIVLALLGSLPFVFVGHQVGGWTLGLALVVRGAGLGTAMVPGMTTIYASVSKDEAPRAAGAVNVLNRIGGSLGTALLTWLLARAATTHSAATAYGHAFGWALALAALALVPALFYPRSAGRKENR